MLNEYLSPNSHFTATEQSVLNYLKEHRNQLENMTIQRLADENFTSKATIFRLAKKLGFNGFTDLMYHFNQQQSATEDAEVQPYVQALSSSIEKIFLQNQSALRQYLERHQTHLPTFYIIGTGYSGIIGEYLYKKILGKGELVYYSNGTDTNALFLNNMHRFTDLLCLSKSGETRSVNEKARIAKQNGLAVISFTHSRHNTLAQLSDINFIIDDDQLLDPNNLNPTQFYSILLLYLEYFIEKCF